MKIKKTMDESVVKKQKKRTLKKSTPVAIPSAVPKAVAYLSNKELYAEIKRCRTGGIMSDKLARMLQLLCAKYGKKGNFAGYSYNDDMQAYAMLMLVRTWQSFNPRKSKNPFAFFTQCIKNSFIQFLNQEKRHRNIRDELLLDQGLNPSFGFSESDDDGQRDVAPQIEDEENKEKYGEDLKRMEEEAEEADTEVNEPRADELMKDTPMEEYYTNEEQDD